MQSSTLRVVFDSLPSTPREGSSDAIILKHFPCGHCRGTSDCPLPNAGTKTTQSVEDCIPTLCVGTSYKAEHGNDLEAIPCCKLTTSATHPPPRKAGGSWRDTRGG